jgi:hypothetical protein
MAKNHVWTNLAQRLRRFLGWRHPGLSARLRTLVVQALTCYPAADLARLFMPAVGAAPAAAAALAAARGVAAGLRPFFQVASGAQTTRNASLALPLLRHLLAETEAGRQAHQQQANATRKFRGRTFTLLPTKAGFTTSCVQVSNMAMMGILKALGKESFPRGPDGKADPDGRHADHDAVWRRWFDVGRIETFTRRFGHRITTDGCSVSVLVSKQSCLVCPDGEACDLVEVRRLLKEDRSRTHFCSVDPGFTDIAVTADRDGRIQSYSSARYYEKAHYNTSRRRTAAWNAQTQAEVQSLRDAPADTASMPAFQLHVRAYLAVLPGLLRHRAERGYRNMRFLRYVGKQRAIDEICEIIAPKGKVSVVGFGDWSGGHGTPIKRRPGAPGRSRRSSCSCGAGRTCGSCPSGRPTVPASATAASSA